MSLRAKNMRSLGALPVALYASLLVLLLAQGVQKHRDGGYKQRFALMERTTGYHLPTYMMHLYRNFKSNFSRPLDALEQGAAKQADTVKSVMAKSKFLLKNAHHDEAKRERSLLQMWSNPSLALKDPLKCFCSPVKAATQTTSEGFNPHPAQGVQGSAGFLSNSQSKPLFS